MIREGINYLDTRLCYSGQKCHKIPETLVKLYGAKVYTLDLSFNELVTLRGLEGFPLLRELILDNNQLTDNIILPYMPYLQTLSINKNKITDIEGLLIKIRHNLPAINYLSLLGNKACPNQLSDISNDEEDYQRYRYHVLYHLPKLKFLDSSKVDDSERIEASRRGKFMKIVKPKQNELGGDNLSPIISNYTPLPRTIRSPNDHKGMYSKCKYKYTGKHSEGNRFISNNDL
ncbi:leucine-rich melanocyte differentiation-associated protein-like isoform X2 [Onthophagus taurus]|uniref:leucine-rich melanocyte differentiation-associated protein-like isoform X2 n=1 Tax=Onthophagus taurus TaxID=166361 RepID=UPI000C20811D|nr:leucine-rich melanocyte differentiation-associated protein-like isoform X2 [Onthophagus taurus]